MPVIVHRPVYRRPWLWGVLLALVAVLIIVFVIAATSPQGGENVTVLAPAPGTVTPPPSQTAPPPAVVEKPVPVPVPGKTRVVEKPVPVPGPTRTKVIEKPVPVPASPESTPDHSALTPGNAGDQTYRDTELPRQVSFEGRWWKATGIVMGPETDQHLVPSDDVTVDGRTVYHKDGSNPPFDRIYAKAEGRDNEFVVYEPAP